MPKRNNEKKRIGDLLVDDGLISEVMLDEALDSQRTNGGKIVEVLVSLGHIKIDEFVNFLSRQPGIASIDLTHYQIPPEVITLVPKELAVDHEIFPIDKMGKLLTLGMACPLDVRTIGRIEKETGLRVKPILCSSQDIETAIKTYYPGEESPEDEALRESVLGKTPRNVTTSKTRSGLKLQQSSKLIKDLTSLPALPDTVCKVQEAMEDLGASPKEIAQTIIGDPSIAAKVLSVSNSAAFGFPSRVDSIELAVALLGLRETYSIVMSAAVINLFEVTKNFDYKVYWEEAMNCAGAARMIGEACRHKNATSLFTAGLLHDIGRIALLETVPDLYRKVPSDLSGNELIKAEQDIVGITHTEAGYELAVNWNLPKNIAEAIRHHHHPEEAYDFQDTIAIVSLAEVWTRTINRDKSHKKEALKEVQSLINLIGMSESVASAAYNRVSDLETVRFSWGEQTAVTA